MGLPMGFYTIAYRKKSIFPSKNLIKNIGFTQNATHTVFPDHPVASLNIQSLKTPLIHPDNKEVDKVYENGFIKKVWVGINSDSLFKITKTKLLYIPFVNKINNWVKKFNA